MITTLLCFLALAACGGDGPSPILEPALEINIVSHSATSVTVRFNSVNATHVRMLCLPTSDASSQSADDVAASGTRYAASPVEITGLTPETAYTLFATACDDGGRHGQLMTRQFSTNSGESEMYSWERERDGLLSFTDMVLCYGGSAHRVPGVWSKQRFAPMVTYVDTESKEHWLFDSFLCLEFVTTKSRADGQRYTYAVGYEGVSAGKAQWQEQIDYWFGVNYGLNALEAAIGEAAGRLGTPPSKRKVVISMPDPIIHAKWLETTSSTTYWGELAGRRLDFSQADDRIAAYKWFIDQVRKRFDAGNYRYIELAGFYVISEELVSTDEGWERELKKSWELFPAVADYLHSLNEALCWIPYNRATGYARWKRFGIDYAYMQPNHFWDDQGTRPLSRFFADIKTCDLAMEFEFDEALLAGKPNSDVYKTRLRNYMSGAISNGIYGKQPLSYYQGENAMYDLWASTDAADRVLYHEFCRFVIGNPLRK